MKNFNKGRRQINTQFINFDPHLCQACWKCIAICKNEVLSKIDFCFHKHAKIKNPEKCSGCRKCINVCEFSALTAITK